MNALASPFEADAIDRAIVVATQGGLPLVARPYHAIGAQIGISGEAVMACLTRMLEAGAIRRIGAVPNHYALGYIANGMSVWDIEDAQVTRLGRVVGELPFVTHCYERVRHPPQWPYNLFAMVHGKSRAEVDEKVAVVASLLGGSCRGSDVLMSKRILKKAGLRVAA